MRRRKEGSKDLCVWETKLLAHWSGRFSFALKVYPILPTWLCVDMLSVDRQARHILPFGVLKWDKLLLMMDRICIRYCKGLIWNQYCGNSPKTKAPVLDNLVRLLRDWSWLLSESLRELSSAVTSTLIYAVLESLRGFYQYLRGVMIIINSLSCVKLLIFHYPSFACAIYRVCVSPVKVSS